MPPTEDIEAAVKSILEPFNENGKDEEGNDHSHAFWDWWVIGGRWSGQKLVEQFDKEKVAEFEKWLQDEKVTVSGVQFGKQQIQPSDQIPKIDAKWNEMFPMPNGELVPCPLFQHSGKSLPGDVLPLSESKGATASVVIFAGPDFDSETDDYTGPPEAKFMLFKQIWNGVTHQDTTWNGSLSSALDMHLENLEQYSDAYRAIATPNDGWIVVTVDYHQ